MHDLIVNLFSYFVGNTTISILDVKVIQRNRGLFRIYCVAKDKVNNNKNDNEPFEFVPGMYIECCREVAIMVFIREASELERCLY